MLNTSGLTYCSIALVVITNGTIEAHFHFFIMIGLIALYQDWVPLGVNIALTVISHGLGSALQADLMFNHPAAQQNPWLWAGIHGIAVLVAYAGVVAFWGITEDDQNDRDELTRRLTEARAAQQAAALEDINAVFLNIAHRSQAIVHRQLQVLDKAERAEEDPDQLGLLFQLDHLTTRERRNAENLIILGGGQPGRQWRNPVPLLELVRSAASETEQYTRVALGRMPRMMVAGRAVGDLIHLIAELLDNATSFSPPDARIDVRGNRVGQGRRPGDRGPGSGHRAGADGAAERDAAQRLQHRSERQVAGLAAGPVRGQPAGPAARHQRHPGRVGLRRRAGDRADPDDAAHRGPGVRHRRPGTRGSGAGRRRPGPDPQRQRAPSAADAPVGAQRPRRRRDRGRGGAHSGAERAARAQGRAHRPEPVPTAEPGSAAEPAPAAEVEPAAADRAATRPPSGRPGLPTRKRQSHVASALRDGPAAAPQAPDPVATEMFTVADDAAAQEARSRMSAFQRGTAGGRADIADDTPPRDRDQHP